MIHIISYLALLTFIFVLGIILGMYAVRAAVVNGIWRADICSDDRRFINDVLGIPNDNYYDT